MNISPQDQSEKDSNNQNWLCLEKLFFWFKFWENHWNNYLGLLSFLAKYNWKDLHFSSPLITSLLWLADYCSHSEVTVFTKSWHSLQLQSCSKLRQLSACVNGKTVFNEKNICLIFGSIQFLSIYCILILFLTLVRKKDIFVAISLLSID